MQDDERQDARVTLLENLAKYSDLCRIAEILNRGQALLAEFKFTERCTPGHDEKNEQKMKKQVKIFEE